MNDMYRAPVIKYSPVTSNIQCMYVLPTTFYSLRCMPDNVRLLPGAFIVN